MSTAACASPPSSPPPRLKPGRTLRAARSSSPTHDSRRRGSYADRSRGRVPGCAPSASNAASAASMPDFMAVCVPWGWRESRAVHVSMGAMGKEGRAADPPACRACVHARPPRLDLGHIEQAGAVAHQCATRECERRDGLPATLDQRACAVLHARVCSTQLDGGGEGLALASLGVYAPPHGTLHPTPPRLACTQVPPCSSARMAGCDLKR